MALVRLEALKPGDVLAIPLEVNEVVLFEAGTVMAEKHIDILGKLEVETIEIETRQEKHFNSRDEAFRNLDNRFSFVEDDPLTISLKYIVKDVLASMERGIQ